MEWIVSYTHFPLLLWINYGTDMATL